MPTPPHNLRKPPPKKSPALPANDPSLANLETENNRLKVYSLAELLRHKNNHHARKKISNLAEVILPWFQTNVTKPAEKLGTCTETWLALVPEKLAAATRLLSFHRGTLTVAAESAIIRSELDSLLRRSLLAQLQAASKGAIYRVKTMIQTRPIPEIS